MRRSGQVTLQVHTSTGDNDEPHLLEYSVVTDERCVEVQLLGAVRLASAMLRSGAPLPGRFSGAASGEAGLQLKETLVEAQAASRRAAAADR